MAELDRAAGERRVVDAEAAYRAAGMDNAVREAALDRLQAARAMVAAAGS